MYVLLIIKDTLQTPTLTVATIYFRHECRLYDHSTPSGPKNFNQLIKITTVRGAVHNDMLLRTEYILVKSKTWFGGERTVAVAQR